MTASISVSILAPRDASAGLRPAIERYLETTGFTFEMVTLDGPDYGSALRRGVADATGRVIVVVDRDLPYAPSAIGDAVAMIDSGVTDVVFATAHPPRDAPALLRWLLVPTLPDRAVRLKAFAVTAAKLVVAETKLAGPACDLEIGFLVNKYAFRVEKLTVELRGDAVVSDAYDIWTGLTAALRVRLTNRNMGYRAARRCPVCFSPEVWTSAQVRGNVIRTCSRCKCRYLNQFTEGEDSLRVRRVLRPHAPPRESAEEESHSESAREKTSVRRLAMVRKQLPPRARLLEIGVRDGSFGAAAAREFEYVGIDPAPPVARHTRARGLEVYCATLGNFVNTGPSFDAIALFHVFENMADPHDALSRIKDLLKPGGFLFVTTFDTEGLLYLLTERKRLAHNFRTHLILYSRSAMIELLEHSGFEIESIGPDFEYRDHKFLRHVVANRWPALGLPVRAALKVLPDPLLVSTGSIRIVAKRRAGPPVNVRAIRSVEPTHAR